MTYQYHALDRCKVCGHLFHEHIPGGCGGVSGEDSGACGCGPEEFSPQYDSPPFRPEVYSSLLWFEIFYLKANGWVIDPVLGLEAPGHDSWSNHKLGRHQLEHGHAVNVQKQRDRQSAWKPKPTEKKE